MKRHSFALPGILLASALMNFSMTAMATSPAIAVMRQCAKQGIVPRKARPATPSPATSRYAAAAARAAIEMKSTLQKAYGWERTQWVLDETYRMEYDARGLVTFQTVTDASGYITRDINSYNDNGLLATRLTETATREGADFRNSSRLSRSYDPIVTSFVTVNNQEVWIDDAWRPSNDYRQNVTRDDAGNVTMVERTVYYGGIQDPVWRMNVDYGPEGAATAITVEELVNDYAAGGFKWETSEIYKDIVWERTDGQIVSVDDLFSGSNRLLSATIEEPEDDMTMHMVADYAGDGSYTVSMSIDMPEISGFAVEMTGTYEYTPLDEYGSSKSRTTTTYSIPGLMSETLWEEEVCRYDRFGLILLEEVTESPDPEDEGEVLVYRRTGEVEYDPQTGYPLSWTVREYDEEVEEMFNAFRAEYYDYVDPAAGISGVGVPEQDCEWFTLQGMRIARPASPGIYLRRAEGRTEKTIVR